MEQTKKNSVLSTIKVSLTTLVFIGILIQILSTQGILMYNVFNLFGFWKLKKLIHILGVGLVLIPFLIRLFLKKKLGVRVETVLLFGYLLIEYLILIVSNQFSLTALFYSIREVLIVFLLISAYQFFEFSNRHFEIIVKLILGLVVLNLIFVLINLIIGGEKYMLLVTGRYYWPIDPLLRFKISTFIGLTYRSPGLIGESASVGFFALFSFFFILNSKLKKYYWLPLLLLFLSFTRSAYLAAFVFGGLLILSKYSLIKILKTLPPVIIIASLILNWLGLLSLYSLKDRVNNWVNMVQLDSNFFTGGNLNRIGNAAPQGSGFLTTMDSYWLFLYHGIGVIGIGLVVYFLFKNIAYTKQNKFFLIGLLVAGLFVTFSQSIPFLVFLPLLVVQNWWRVKND